MSATDPKRTTLCVKRWQHQSNHYNYDNPGLVRLRRPIRTVPSQMIQASSQAAGSQDNQGIQPEGQRVLGADTRKTSSKPMQMTLNSMVPQLLNK